MIKYQEKLQDFYKMRDTLITEGYKYPECIEAFEKVEKREIALEIIKNKQVAVDEFIMCIKKADNPLEEYNAFAGSNALTQQEYDLLKEVLING